jgi:hypothetical protein
MRIFWWRPYSIILLQTIRCHLNGKGKAGPSGGDLSGSARYRAVWYDGMGLVWLEVVRSDTHPQENQ